MHETQSQVRRPRGEDVSRVMSEQVIANWVKQCPELKKVPASERPAIIDKVLHSPLVWGAAALMIVVWVVAFGSQVMDIGYGLNRRELFNALFYPVLVPAAVIFAVVLAIRRMLVRKEVARWLSAHPSSEPAPVTKTAAVPRATGGAQSQVPVVVEPVPAPEKPKKVAHFQGYCADQVDAEDDPLIEKCAVVIEGEIFEIVAATREAFGKTCPFLADPAFDELAAKDTGPYVRDALAAFAAETEKHGYVSFNIVNETDEYNIYLVPESDLDALEMDLANRGHWGYRAQDEDHADINAFFERAAKASETHPVDDPANSRLWFHVGQRRYRRCNYWDAEELKATYDALKRSLDTEPSAPRFSLLYLLLHCTNMAYRNEECVEFADRLLRMYYDTEQRADDRPVVDGRIWEIRGASLRSLGREREAAASFAQALDASQVADSTIPVTSRAIAKLVEKDEPELAKEFAALGAEKDPDPARVAGLARELQAKGYVVPELGLTPEVREELAKIKEANDDLVEREGRQPITPWDRYPRSLMGDVLWDFHQPSFATKDEFAKALRAYQKNLGIVLRDHVIESLNGSVNIIYELVDPETEDEDVRDVTIAPDGDVFSTFELLYKIHEAVRNDYLDDDWHFFEGLEIDEGAMEGPNVPCYRLVLGS